MNCPSVAIPIKEHVDDPDCLHCFKRVGVFYCARIARFSDGLKVSERGWVSGKRGGGEVGWFRGRGQFGGGRWGVGGSW
jgi:hypothetical protein